MLQALEKLLFIAGAIAMGVFAYAYGAPKLNAASSVKDFSQMKTLVARSPNMALWSPERVLAYENASREKAALGILTIDSVAIEAPIFPGTSDEILNRGVGWIEGTSPLSGGGNIGLAAHRDGFFRGLKDVQTDDEVVLTTLRGERRYRVTGTDIIEPHETYVLEPTNAAALTLVTCYPFYFVGNAPNRFVVFATAVGAAVGTADSR